MCSEPIATEHAHLLEPETRRLICACDACSLLFDGEGAAKYRRVPRQARFLRGFQLSDAAWDNLLLPINLAYFFFSSPANRITAFYPSPAGATESTLTLDAWQEIVRANPILEQMQPDVEALLIKRISRPEMPGSPEYYLAPIDACYKLVGLLRTHWRGLSGGSEVWQHVEAFFHELRAKATTDA
jgi:hypothetical protein